MESSPSSSQTDRKTIERNRRNQMKALYSKLQSLVPHQNSRLQETTMSLPDQLEEAANYIKRLQINLERMKEKKDSLMGLRAPQIEIQEAGPALEVVLVTGLDCQYMFSETIRILHQEGAEIVNASFSVVNDAILHTIHSKVGDECPSNETARISARLRKFVQDTITYV